MKDSCFDVESSTSRFFHLTRYSLITLFHSCLVLLSEIFSSSKMTFLLHQALEKQFELESCLLLPSLSKKHWKLGGPLKMQEALPCKPYYLSSPKPYKDHSTWVLIYCLYLVSWGESICKVVASKIPNPLFQNSFRYDVYLLVVSSCFFDVTNLSFII